MSHRLNYEAAALTTQPPWLGNFIETQRNYKKTLIFNIEFKILIDATSIARPIFMMSKY